MHLNIGHDKTPYAYTLTKQPQDNEIKKSVQWIDHVLCDEHK